MTENFVCSQMKTLSDIAITYYSSENSQLELDFVIQLCDRIIPIEVKAEENLKSKSLKTFIDKNNGLHGIRFSMSDYREQEWLTNVPLYAIGPFLSTVRRKRQKAIHSALSQLL